MAKTGAVWGIDLGQSALKALRCRAGDTPDQIVADAFDYIEYPKLLSQPEANPAELVKDALTQFLSRNSLKGDRVAISVSGQSGLSRFIKLPPVESKKIPDIVKYEARQQIPFALEDVVWDYEKMAGGSEEEGFALETEVGLFAMKRDQVFRTLRPFTEAGIEVDIIQLTPVALYNFATFDQMADVPPPEQYDPEDPPQSLIVLSLGADMSDLVVTNGYRVWQRTINLGGSHFTKALTKQMKLTFASAEHLKRNAMKAEDPKAVFQAMRPTFGELLGEVQRSLSFFQNLDRRAKLGRVVALGNAMKLRGLHKYLAQNLGLEVVEVEEYPHLVGPTVTTAPAFKDNLLSFAVCYGLAVQGLGKGRLSTNLLPREIMKERMIRAKKPWAVAAVAALLLGCMAGFVGKWREWDSARETPAFQSAFSSATSTKSMADQNTSSYDAAKQEFEATKAIGDRLAGINDRRLVVAEMLKAVNDCLPHDDGQQPENITERKEIHIESWDCEYFADLKTWFGDVKDIWDEDHKAAAAAPAGAPAPAAPADAPPADPAAAPPAEAPPDLGPEGPGWVIELRGHHYHNGNKNMGNETGQFVKNTFFKELEEKGDVQLPSGQFSVKELGIGYPVLVNQMTRAVDEAITNPNVANNPAPAAAPGPAQPGAAAAAPATPAIQYVPKYDFVIQFCWKPTPLKKRLENREKKEQPQQEQPALAGSGQ